MSTKYQSKFITLAGIFLFFSISLYAADRVHIIKSGETIYGISRFYGVTVDEILFINNMADARSAQVGQHLIIPIVKDLRGTQKPLRVEPLDQRQSVASTAAPVQNTQGVAHTVQKNETLYGLARAYGTSVEEICRLNNFSVDYHLKYGEKVRVPANRTSTSNKTSTPSVPTYQSSNLTASTVSAKPKASSSKPFDLSVTWPVAVKGAVNMNGKLSGVILTASKSEVVRSVASGTVISAGPYRGYGRVAIVQNANAYIYIYAGCESLSVKAGDKVSPGTELGRLGIDALSGKPQLSFMVYRNQSPIDPVRAPRT